jgi:hypothetical protein
MISARSGFLLNFEMDGMNRLLMSRLTTQTSNAHYIVISIATSQLEVQFCSHARRKELHVRLAEFMYQQTFPYVQMSLSVTCGK